MRRHMLAAVALAFATALVPSAVRSQEPRNVPEAAAVTLEDGSELWFVEFSNPPLADGGRLNTIIREQAVFRAAATAAGIRYTERKAFRNLWNGLSLAVNIDDLGKLRRVPGVAELYPVVAFEPPEGTPVEDPNLLTALSMTGADIAQSSLGLTGQGIRVGIIDTGLDYDHPALGGDGVIRTDSNVFPTARVVAGSDLVGDAFTAGLTPVPDPYPDDCNGHGTHVSGIVGASGGITGVAPGVVFGAYRVFGCTGSTTSDVMIEAMEMALADGMHVVNMSIGSAFRWPSYPTATASDRLVNKGVVVVASIGNSGSNGLYAASAPGVGKKVIGVASFQNTHINQSAFTVSPDDYAVAYNVAANAAPPPAGGTFPLARTGTQTTTNDACSPLPAGSLAGKVALIRRGTCSFRIKAENAANAGAIAVVIYNNVAGALNPSLGTPPLPIVAVGISGVDGNLLDSRLALGSVDLTWGATLSTPNTTGGLIASSSSYGLSPDLALKPDIGAPGGFILSTYPLESGATANISGTSMSSPHVAGAAALLLQAKPNTPSNAVRDILQNNAEPKRWFGNPGLGFLENVHRQGAGMLQIDRAVLATTKVQPGKLSLGESEAGPVVRTLTIENKSGTARLYSLSHEPALATGPNTFTPSFFHAPSSVAFSANPVAVAAGGTATVDVTISPNAGLSDRGLFGGYIRLTPDDASDDVRVPFAGFKGDYQGFPVLTPTANGFPWLAKRVGTSIVNQPGGATYTMSGTDFPVIAYHLDHQASLFEIVVNDLNGVSYHRAFRSKDVSRNSGAATFFAFDWDGMTTGGNKTYLVPNGDYRMTINVVRPLGDSQNPAHVESWTSPVLTIARPDIVAAEIPATPGSGGESADGTLEEDPGQVVGVRAPRILSLAPARPNPFAGDLALRFSLPQAGPVSLEAFDVAGRLVRSWQWSSLEAGDHALNWDGRSDQGQTVHAGIVVFRLNAMDRSLTTKAVRLP